MKNQFAIISILLLLLTSCKSTAVDLEKFEKILGPEKSETLTKLTEDFENNFLAKNYPNTDLSESYWNFIVEITQQSFPNKSELVSKENEKNYISSGLINEKYQYPDSVWVKEREIVSRWTYKDERGKIKSYEDSRFINSKDSVKIDSLFALAKNQIKFNYYGNYFKALEVVKSESSFINLYYTYTAASGYTPVSSLLQGINDYNMEITGTVERRVLVLALVY
ncbi:hypothetical protein [Maribacter sp. Asnod1-A12]|uniref:hypothetical protein n=1 Tax=Maribacter sp. Asnod1-A12 TaxID=3160576 RepID=UPI00386CDD4A